MGSWPSRAQRSGFRSDHLPDPRAEETKSRPIPRV